MNVPSELSSADDLGLQLPPHPRHLCGHRELSQSPGTGRQLGPVGAHMSQACVSPRPVLGHHKVPRDPSPLCPSAQQEKQSPI